MLQENLNNILKTIPSTTQLIAVSKTKPSEDIQEIFESGQLDFGENKVQELCTKYESLDRTIRWHMIGHLQSNKVKYIAPFVHLIHGVDSFKLLKEINKQALKNNRVISCLLQFHIASESTKFGLDLDEAQAIIESPEFEALQNVAICGVMGMATFTQDKSQIRKEFKSLKTIFDTLKSTNFGSSDTFKEISMGMSGDYAIAIEEGSTMVRVGSKIFGHR